MKQAYTFAAAPLLILLGLSCAAPEASVPSGEREAGEVKAWLPEGDADAGREAFVALRCNACHEVRGDRELPPLTAVDPGPELDQKMARFSQGELVSAIVVPSHSTLQFHASPEGTELSRMADFNEVMTVRQLVDIVSYLERVAQP